MTERWPRGTGRVRWQTIGEGLHCHCDWTLALGATGCDSAQLGKQLRGDRKLGESGQGDRTRPADENHLWNLSELDQMLRRCESSQVAGRI